MARAWPADQADWISLREEIVSCRKCPRLVRYRESVARKKRRAFADWEYWGRPVPGFGDPKARLLVIGLAPAAHGGNRTGRIFTGDRSGDWLYRALYEFGFANQPTSVHRDDGLELHDAYVTAVVRCAPPQNRPERKEIVRCRPFLMREWTMLPVLVVVALGQIAFRGAVATWQEISGEVLRPVPRFAHGAGVRLGDVLLIASYHPSQRNTQTGFLTRPMFHKIFRLAREHLQQCTSESGKGRNE